MSLRQTSDCIVTEMPVTQHPVLRKKESRSLRGLLLQAVFVMQAPEHGRLFNAMTGWQLVVWSKNPIRMKSKDDSSRGPDGPDQGVTPR